LTRRSSLFIAGGDSGSNISEPFEYIVENSNQGILVVIGDKPVYFNKKILNYTGYSHQDLFDHSVTEFIHPDDKDTIIRNYIWKRQSTHPGEAATFRVVKKNGGARWVELNTAMITWEGRNATLCFLSDITTHKKFEKELSGYRNNLEEIILKRTNELQEASKQLCAEISRREKTESVLHEKFWMISTTVFLKSASPERCFSLIEGYVRFQDIRQKKWLGFITKHSPLQKQQNPCTRCSTPFIRPVKRAE
jgi:PAS domain S-box-containing protein